MRAAAGAAAVGLLLAAGAAGAQAPAASGPPAVTGVELASPTALPEALVRTALLPMAGRPLSRPAVRESLERLWGLDLFADVRVEAAAEAGGVRLRFLLRRKPYVERIQWRGETGLARAELAAAAALPLDGDAGPERLEQARQALLALYRREGYLGARVGLEARTAPETGATLVTFLLAAGERARVGPLRIQGLQEYPARRFRRALGFSEGEWYREETVRRGLQAAQERMREDGRFEAVVRAAPPAWDAGENRVAVRLEVREGPAYRVEFKGERALRESVLRDALPFAATGIVDALAIETGARLLRRAYRERGHHFAEATGELDADGRTIRYRVQPGPRVRVAEVAFEGNQAVGADRLRGLLQTRRSRLLRPAYFTEEALERDLRVLLAFYRSQGMAGTEVGPPQVDFSDDGREARVRIPLRESRALRVGAIAVEGAGIVPPAEILAALPLQAGDPWGESQAEEVRRAVAGLHARRGYGASRVTIREQARDGRVDVTIQVREGELTRAGRVLVSGLVRTREQVVRREVFLEPGAPYDPEAVLQAERRLAELGIFDRVVLGPLRPPPAPFTDVAVRLEEAKAWRLDLGAGYSTDHGTRASVELGHDNLLGTARRVSLRERLSQIEERTDLTYQQPWTLGSRWRLSGNLFRERREEIGFDVQRAGAVAEIQRELLDRQRPLRASLQYHLRWVRRFNVDPALIQEAVEPGGEIIASLRPALTWDRRNDPLNPTRGSLHFVSLEGAGFPLGSEVSFLKSELATTWLLDVVGPTVLALSARVGLAGALGATPDLPIEDRFFAGGETTIRGYGRNRVGPVDESGNPRGGNTRILLNAEWRFPIWRFVSGALFVDTGTVRPDTPDLRLSEFKTGVGGGLRLVTPVGPLRFDVGYGLNPVRGDEDRLAFYFSVGYPF